MTGPSQSSSSGAFAARLRRSYIIFTLSFVVLILVLGWQESRGLPSQWVGYAFLLSTVCLYAFIGIICRTSDAREYYVAGRAVPAFYNGMATAADWMSVASFMGIAGTLYMTGYNGLAFVMGWTGGYVLLALLLAPYLRKFGQYTIPDFMGARYGGNMARMAGVLCATLCSLIYLVAQVYGIGMITSRLTSMSFELGILIALGGMLVCSFLGGMRAVTWTQVGQYIIMLVAYLVPVVWLSVKHAQTPVPQVAATRMLPTIDLLNNEVLRDPGEIEVRALWAARADAMQARLDALPQSWATERAKMRTELHVLQAQRSSWVDIRILERELANYPENALAARDQWIKARNTYRARAAPPTAQGPPFPSADSEARALQQRNFLALAFCLMLGTAGMPHILMRSYTTRSVSGARRSVFWCLFFILLLYSLTPAMALFVKFEVYTQLVGTRFDELPIWANGWSRLDVQLLDVVDLNRDGVVQLAEIVLSNDMVVLALADVGGLPYVVSALVAVGALAAALSTADGLLLTVSNALSHDVWFRFWSPSMHAARRVLISKGLLLLVAFLTAWGASRVNASILALVSAAFSFAASSFFPALVMGIFWKRANKWGAISGMVVGLTVTALYMSLDSTFMRHTLLHLPLDAPSLLWFGIEPIAAGIFGAPAAFATIVVVSLLTPRPDPATNALVDFIRYPGAGMPPSTTESVSDEWADTSR